MEMYHQLTGLLAKEQFQLGKWKTNNEELVNKLNFELASMNESVSLSDETMTVLGLSWASRDDQFRFNVPVDTNSQPATKRIIVSEVAKLYDPNGYLAPVVILAKIFIQELWRIGVSWDEPVPTEINERWRQFRAELPSLNELRIDRWIGTTKQSKIQIHGFADASSKAFGAAIYIRSDNGNGNFKCALIASKTRVAPVKTVSIPRLELCAAELLGRLLKDVQRVCNFEQVPYTLWSDSSVTLHWIHKLPADLKVFVANRVSSIQENTIVQNWRHISTEHNPADIASRGLLPSDLIRAELWWNGPSWLKLEENQWPVSISQIGPEVASNMKEEIKPSSVQINIAVLRVPLQHKGETVLDKCSTLGRAIRVTAYAWRFLEHARVVEHRMSNSLSNIELNRALEYWIRHIQHQEFAEEFDQLKSTGQVAKKSKLLTLCPFEDQTGILRIRGRLGKSEMTFDEKYPIIIPAHSRFTTLLMREAHKVTMHGGTQAMLQYIRAKYWVLGGRRTTKATIKRCIACIRQRQQTIEQIGDLPAGRITQARPFTVTGVDYAGPINIKAFRGRNVINLKGYIAVFICMASRAVHLELVGELTSAAFIAAFRRFTGRRGNPQQMFSDNGTNFVGADNELKEIYNTWKSRLTTEHLSQLGIQWQFITPGAPHQVGLCESAVKSAKHHLRRIIGHHKLTFEEYYTVLVQIEACLNSRPIMPISDDHQDLNAITPAHALVGEQIVQPLARNLEDVPMNRIQQWNIMQKLVQDFWAGWRNEYLNTLQTRNKWNQAQNNLKIGDMVVIKNENLPSTLWELGRISNVFTGDDGLVRSAQVRTATSDIERPVQKLCQLPVLDNEQAAS